MILLPDDVLNIIMSFLNIDDLILFRHISQKFNHIICNIKNNTKTQIINTKDIEYQNENFVQNIFFNNSDMLKEYVIKWKKRIIVCSCDNMMEFPFIKMNDSTLKQCEKDLVKMFGDNIMNHIIICRHLKVYYESDCDYEEVETYYFLYDCEKNCIHVIIQCEIMSLVSGFNKKYKYYFVKNIGIVYDLILNPNVVINFIDSHSYYV